VLHRPLRLLAEPQVGPGALLALVAPAEVLQLLSRRLRHRLPAQPAALLPPLLRLPQLALLLQPCQDGGQALVPALLPVPAMAARLHKGGRGGARRHAQAEAGLLPPLLRLPQLWTSQGRLLLLLLRRRLQVGRAVPARRRRRQLRYAALAAAAAAAAAATAAAAAAAAAAAVVRLPLAAARPLLCAARRAS
jgi:hypothetical protein